MHAVGGPGLIWGLPRGRWMQAAGGALALLFGCGGDGSSSAAPDMTAPPSVCANQAGADAYVAGLQKPSMQQLFTVTLQSSDPGPPAAGVNTWNIQVRDKAGSEPNDLTIKALPWMPLHNHGTSVKAPVTPVGTAGSYTITPLYLFMPGLWQVTLDLQSPPPASATDQAVFTFCVESARPL